MTLHNIEASNNWARDQHIKEQTTDHETLRQMNEKMSSWLVKFVRQWTTGSDQSLHKGIFTI